MRARSASTLLRAIMAKSSCRARASVMGGTPIVSSFEQTFHCAIPARRRGGRRCLAPSIEQKFQPLNRTKISFYTVFGLSHSVGRIASHSKRRTYEGDEHMTASRSNRLARSIRLVLLAGPLAVAGNAHAGDVAGRVVDAVSGRPLPNATVSIPGTGRSAVSDRSGDYRITDVPAGTHEVSAEYVGFAAGTQSVSVDATGTASAEFRLASGMAEITVIGYRLAQATALQDKKASVNIKDSITADDAGKLPDRNAAETLARVPGLSVTTDQGEGRYVNVRGIDAALSNVDRKSTRLNSSHLGIS